MLARTPLLILAAFLSGFLAAPAIHAQPRGETTRLDGEWWAWAYPEVERAHDARRDDDRYDDDRYDDDRYGGNRIPERPRDGRWREEPRYDRRHGKRHRRSGYGHARYGPNRPHHRRYRVPKRRGPRYCRSGAGHPVYGMRWCYEKGYARRAYVYRPPRSYWRRCGWTGVVFHGTYPRRHRRPRVTVHASVIIDLLGPRTYARLERERRRLGYRGPLVGRWLAPDRHRRVLQVRAGHHPLAEFTDANGDRRVAAVLIHEGRW